MELCCCAVVFLAAPLLPALVGRIGPARALALLWAYLAGGMTILVVCGAAWIAGFLSTGGKDPNTMLGKHVGTACAAGMIVGILVLTLVGRQAEVAVIEEEGGNDPGPPPPASPPGPSPVPAPAPTPTP